RERVLVLQRNTSVRRGQRQQPVERAGIQHVPAQLRRQQPGDRALPGAAWAVDGDDGNVVHGCSLTSTPSCRASAAKPGYDVLMLSEFIIVTGASATVAATANAMAMRWTPAASTSPTRRRTLYPRRRAT